MIGWRMKKKLIAAACGIIVFAAVAACIAPCWSFRPVSIAYNATFVDQSDLNGVDFAKALATVLERYGEKHIRVSSRVYVTRALAWDQELRSKYTIEAIREVEGLRGLLIPKFETNMFSGTNKENH